MDLQGDAPMTDIKDIIKTSNVAVITGGASGIGLAAARRFAEAGMCIAIADRNADQLGAATIEADGQGPDLLDDPVGLLGLQCAALMTRQALPERERHEGAYHAFRALLSAFAIPEIWPAIYVRYEAGLLEELGYGLDLSACAVSGTRDNLCYVSPKSARAVSAESGAPYKDKLLPLPQFLLSSQGGINGGDVVDGDDRGVMQRGNDVALADETLVERFVVGAEQHLDRHFAMQRLLGRQEDFGHPPSAQPAMHDIAGYLG